MLERIFTKKNLLSSLTKTAISTVIVFVVFAIVYCITEEKFVSWKFMFSLPILYFLNHFFLKNTNLKWRDVFKKKQNKIFKE